MVGVILESVKSEGKEYNEYHSRMNEEMESIRTEEPLRGRGEGHTIMTGSVREDIRAVNPRNRSPSYSTITKMSKKAQQLERTQ